MKINKTKGKCWCLKCKQPFNGWVFTEIYGKHTGELSQRERFCKDCIKQLTSEHIQYIGLDYETTLYTTKQVNINHKMHKVVVPVKLDYVELYNSCDLYSVKDKLDLPYFGYDILETTLKDFSPQKLKSQFSYYFIADDGKKYKRELNEIYKSKQDCLDYADKCNGYKMKLPITEEDMYVMREQNLIYNTIKNFLKSDEAIQFNITGLDAKVDDGYVNVEWKFGSRKDKDIKE